MLALAFAGFFALPAQGQFYYGLRQDFGKNRVQYNDFDWVFYRFDRFDIYFYRGNDELAAQTARFTEKELIRIENLLDAPLDDRVQILVFNNLSDLKQSNVNSNDDEDYQANGVTRISGRRLFVYFDGSYKNLKENLRSGLAEVVLSNLIYGSFTESIRNSALLNLPGWYTEGLISYLGSPGQNTEMETWVRDGFLSGKYKNINVLMEQDARYAGHSIWNYIAETYGQKVIKNVVYMAIVNRNIESGFLYILGNDLETVIGGWKDWLAKKYRENDNLPPLPEKGLLKIPKRHRITQTAASPDGRYLSYVVQRFSRYRVYLYDFEKNKRKKILTDGYRIAQNSDYSYPIMTWHPNGEIMAMITEEKGFIYLNYYNLKDKNWEKKPFFKFDKILSFSYSEDGKRFLMSAVKDGQSDIFIYTILNTKIEQLTNDSYDDLHPAWIEGGRRVAWSSNRPNNVLKNNEEATVFPKNDLDLFAMPAAVPDDTAEIWRLTQSPNVDEIAPKAYQPGFVTFLSDRSGVRNRHLIEIDSSIGYVDTTTHYEYDFTEYQLTNSRRNILAHNYFPEREKITDVLFFDQRFRVYETPMERFEDLSAERISGSAPPTPSGESSAQTPAQSSLPQNSPLYYPGVDFNDFEVNIYDYQFDDDQGRSRPSRNEKPRPRPVKILPEPGNVMQPQNDTLEIPPKRNYFLSFYEDDFSVSFDNIFLNPQYQRFTGFVSSDLLNAGFNMQFKAGVMDLMHDYRIIAGLQTGFQPLPGTSLAPNASFFVGVVDYKNRLDKEYIYNRRSELLIRSFVDYQRIITHEATSKFTWPFNPVSSVRGSLGYRLDQTIQLSRDQASYETPTLYQNYGIAKLAYVYDNSRKIGLNLYAGTRMKIFTEYYRNLQETPTGLHTAGIDFRNYQILHKNLIWANRFASGTSFGPEKLIYIMGGVDNAFSPEFDPTTPIATENNYIFQTLVTNMRGFFQNVRNGNSFAVINSELRWPVFSYLLTKPIRSDFIKNFQVIGFGDVGTAWNGLNPYDRENAINTRVVNFGSTSGNSRVVLDSQKDPIVMSYGLGLRTRLFGYFLRFDWAWPVEDGLVLDRQFCFSIGMDF